MSSLHKNGAQVASKKFYPELPKGQSCTIAFEARMVSPPRTSLITKGPKPRSVETSQSKLSPKGGPSSGIAMRDLRGPMSFDKTKSTRQFSRKHSQEVHARSWRNTDRYKVSSARRIIQLLVLFAFCSVRVRGSHEPSPGTDSSVTHYAGTTRRKTPFKLLKNTIIQAFMLLTFCTKMGAAKNLDLIGGVETNLCAIGTCQDADGGNFVDVTDDGVHPTISVTENTSSVIQDRSVITTHYDKDGVEIPDHAIQNGKANYDVKVGRHETVKDLFVMEHVNVFSPVEIDILSRGIDRIYKDSKWGDGTKENPVFINMDVQANSGREHEELVNLIKSLPGYAIMLATAKKHISKAWGQPFDILDDNILFDYINNKKIGVQPEGTCHVDTQLDYLYGKGKMVYEAKFYLNDPADYVPGTGACTFNLGRDHSCKNHFSIFPQAGNVVSHFSTMYHQVREAIMKKSRRILTVIFGTSRYEGDDKADYVEPWVEEQDETIELGRRKQRYFLKRRLEDAKQRARAKAVNKDSLHPDNRKRSAREERRRRQK